MNTRPMVAVGDVVCYFPQGVTAQTEALVVRVHSQHLVDVDVPDAEGNSRLVPFVPFLCDGEFDPLAPNGHCQPDVDRRAPAPVVLNPGTEHEFKLDPRTGDPL